MALHGRPWQGRNRAGPKVLCKVWPRSPFSAQPYAFASTCTLNGTLRWQRVLGWGFPAQLPGGFPNDNQPNQGPRCLPLAVHTGWLEAHACIIGESQTLCWDLSHSQGSESVAAPVPVLVPVPVPETHSLHSCLGSVGTMQLCWRLANILALGMGW